MHKPVLYGRMKPAASSAIGFVIGLLVAAVVVTLAILTGGTGGPSSASSSESVGGCTPSALPADPGRSVPPETFVFDSELQNNNSNPYGGPIPETNLTVYSHSASVYYVYVLSQAQYESQAGLGNGTGGQGTVVGPATSFVWSSGPVMTCQHSIRVGNGNWFVVLYNPSSTAAASVSISGGTSN
jgi:hypothetical protein